MTVRRTIAGGAAACVAGGGIAWLLGATVRGSVLIALMAAGLVPLLLHPLEDTKVLPPVPPDMRHGARVEISRLSWAMRRRGGSDTRVVRRLRATAYRRLADLHLDPDHPLHTEQARRALGSWAHGVVTGGQTELSRGDVVRLVDAIERLGLQRSGADPDQRRNPADQQ